VPIKIIYQWYLTSTITWSKKMKQIMKYRKQIMHWLNRYIMIRTTRSYYYSFINHKLTDIILNANIYVVQFQKTGLWQPIYSN
jgi:hypothetical protein